MPSHAKQICPTACVLIVCGALSTADSAWDMSAMDTGHEIYAIAFPGVGSQLLAITIHTLG
jgi:hypothetical protein